MDISSKTAHLWGFSITCTLQPPTTFFAFGCSFQRGRMRPRCLCPFCVVQPTHAWRLAWGPVCLCYHSLQGQCWLLKLLLLAPLLLLAGAYNVSLLSTRCSWQLHAHTSAGDTAMTLSINRVTELRCPSHLFCNENGASCAHPLEAWCPICLLHQSLQRQSCLLRMLLLALLPLLAASCCQVLMVAAGHRCCKEGS